MDNLLLNISSVTLPTHIPDGLYYSMITRSVVKLRFENMLLISPIDESISVRTVLYNDDITDDRPENSKLPNTKESTVINVEKMLTELSKKDIFMISNVTLFESDEFCKAINNNVNNIINMLADQNIAYRIDDVKYGLIINKNNNNNAIIVFNKPKINVADNETKYKFRKYLEYKVSNVYGQIKLIKEELCNLDVLLPIKDRKCVVISKTIYNKNPFATVDEPDSFLFNTNDINIIPIDKYKSSQQLKDSLVQIYDKAEDMESVKNAFKKIANTATICITEQGGEVDDFILNLL